MTLVPRRLVKGDTIGIVSPASPFPAWFPRRFARSVSNLESKGYKVKLGPHVRDKLGHKAGNKEDRLSDLHEMYRDKSVRLLMTTLGGYNSNELLDDLDYDLVRRNPKGLIGYSDITALHLAIHSKTGLTSFYGPHLMSQLVNSPTFFRILWSVLGKWSVKPVQQAGLNLPRSGLKRGWNTIKKMIGLDQ